MSKAPAPKRARASQTQRTAYLVLGMHRSGTSAVTQLLALAGASLPANVMPGDEHNAKGYFEPWKIAIFDDERLRAAGSAWDDPFAFPFRPLPPDEELAWTLRALAMFDEEFGQATWPLMKDPRATVLLPFWRAVLAERGVATRCVIPVRHPLAVAGCRCWSGAPTCWPPRPTPGTCRGRSWAMTRCSPTGGPRSPASRLRTARRCRN
jgi:hypothetical protein